MQTYRIEEMAQAIYADTRSTFAWSELSDEFRETYRNKARSYAAVLLGGNPVVHVEHGVRFRGGKVRGGYKVAQTVIGDDVQVQRQKIVYPAAAFVTAWVERAE